MPNKRTIGRSIALGSLRAGFAAANAISPRLAAAGAARLFLSTRRHPMPARERAHLQAARRVDLASDAITFTGGCQILRLRRVVAEQSVRLLNFLTKLPLSFTSLDRLLGDDRENDGECEGRDVADERAERSLPTVRHSPYPNIEAEQK